LYVAWPKLLKLSGAEVRDNLLRRQLAVPFRGFRREASFASEPIIEVFAYGNLGGINQPAVMCCIYLSA
jgi:hypothetical protein